MACCSTTTKSSTCQHLIEKHTRILFWATIASRLWTWILVALASRFPLFDSSPLILLPDSDKTLRAALRWDVFHFGSIADNVYAYEYQWAFFPGTPILMRAMGKILGLLTPGANAPVTWGKLVLGGTLLSMSTSTTKIMYTLSLRILGSHHLALVASLLALIPSSPATLYFAPGTEPFFTYLSYDGVDLNSFSCCCANSDQAC
jgi:phosphatidylinositol glycan class V